MSIWMIGKNLMIIITRKKMFYTYLNMEDYTDADYAHEESFCKDFEINN